MNDDSAIVEQELSAKRAVAEGAYEALRDSVKWLALGGGVMVVLALGGRDIVRGIGKTVREVL